MSIFPKSRDEWIALPLFPFKAWIVTAWPLYLIFRACITDSRHDIHLDGHCAIAGYFYSVPVLLLGALIQSIFCQRGMATQTALYAVGSIILVYWVWHFYPMV